MAHHNPLFQLHLDRKRNLKAFDKLMLAVAFFYPLSGIPQIIIVFSGQTDGVSIYSWLGFLIFTTAFLAYSIIHKINPMIITYAMWWLVDALVVTGILLN